MPPVTELSARARDVFRMVVEAYLHSGTPVGSKLLAASGGLNLSPASIRGVMADLEAHGLLGHPHTSAGRVPTELGLRLFVDGMMQAAEPSAEERAAIESGLRREGPIEEALSQATAALSGLSACAGIVLVPKAERRLKQFGFAPLGAGQALAVLVGEDGSVENRVIATDPGVGPSELAEAGNYLTARLGGRTLAEARRELAGELERGRAALNAAAAGLVAQGLATWATDGADRPVLIVRGQANLLEGAEADLERVRGLLDELESTEEIARLLDSARAGESLKIFIGSENKLFSLSGSSVIAAPYRGGNGRVVGVVGVIGPTRLNYARVVPMVDFTAQALTRLMG